MRPVSFSGVARCLETDTERESSDNNKFRSKGKFVIYSADNQTLVASSCIEPTALPSRDRNQLAVFPLESFISFTDDLLLCFIGQERYDLKLFTIEKKENDEKPFYFGALLCNVKTEKQKHEFLSFLSKNCHLDISKHVSFADPFNIAFTLAWEHNAIVCLVSFYKLLHLIFSSRSTSSTSNGDSSSVQGVAQRLWYHMGA
jgi:hypothetical protein